MVLHHSGYPVENRLYYPLWVYHSASSNVTLVGNGLVPFSSLSHHGRGQAPSLRKITYLITKNTHPRPTDPRFLQYITNEFEDLFHFE